MKKNAGPNLEQKFFVSMEETKFDAQQGTIEGYASLFDEVDQGNDMVVSGAYKSSLSRRKPKSVKMLWQHDPRQPIGMWDEIYEDEKGLYVKGRLLMSIQQGKEAAALIEAGAIDGMSIGYRTINADRQVVGEKTVRALKELDLWEISMVTFPMLPTARIVSRKGEDWGNPRFVEQYLRDGGCSQSAARQIATAAKGADLGPSDLGDDVSLAAAFAASLNL